MTDRCGAEWIHKGFYEGPVLTRPATLSVPCTREKGHDGAHSAVIQGATTPAKVTWS